MSLYSVQTQQKPYTQVVGNTFVIAFLTDTTITFGTDIPGANVLFVSPGTSSAPGAISGRMGNNINISKNMTFFVTVDATSSNITVGTRNGPPINVDNIPAPFLPHVLKGLKINGKAVDKFSKTDGPAKPNSGNKNSTGIVLIYWNISDILNKYKDIQDADNYIVKQMNELYQVPGSNVDTLRQQYEGTMISGAFFTVMATCLAYYVFYQL